MSVRARGLYGLESSRVPRPRPRCSALTLGDLSRCNAGFHANYSNIIPDQGTGTVTAVAPLTGRSQGPPVLARAASPVPRTSAPAGVGELRAVPPPDRCRQAAAPVYRGASLRSPGATWGPGWLPALTIAPAAQLSRPPPRYDLGAVPPRAAWERCLDCRGMWKQASKPASAGSSASSHTTARICMREPSRALDSSANACICRHTWEALVRSLRQARRRRRLTGRRQRAARLMWPARWGRGARPPRWQRHRRRCLAVGNPARGCGSATGAHPRRPPASPPPGLLPTRRPASGSRHVARACLGGCSSRPRRSPGCCRCPALGSPSAGCLRPSRARATAGRAAGAAAKATPTRCCPRPACPRRRSAGWLHWGCRRRWRCSCPRRRCPRTAH